MSSHAWLRRQAVGWSFPRAGSLAAVLQDIEFVQADPIRSPARAQDLILRQRVRGYRVGDLDRYYPKLELDEEQLYAYGFAVRRLRPYLHPRRDRHAPDGKYVLTGRVAEVLEFVREHGVTHPREVQEYFGHQRVTNDWGGKSSATTLDLEVLRHYGYLRVADRIAGVRRYEPAPPLGDPIEPEERARVLTLRVARTLAPVPLASLSSAVSYLIRMTRGPSKKPGGRPVVLDLLARGELEAANVGGTRYVWPADLVPVEADPAARVRILAPFDPVVWDRSRFGELWGWDYRFEAYTPEAKRVMGYYAMPLLWRDRVIGWANCAGAGQDIEVGYVDRAPAGTTYAKALDAEIERLRAFLRTGLSRPAQTSTA
ncbi:crosslink repair DNA glycosylase YcaQ family protein [Kribbella sancticallisti]|uniref:Crosslink repair DNA glycosylase YcaQ family protein n=1 Tax=Kribbella sancticallisti TaxID=460087 RepID=A0ABN2DU64_9ACTN